jgi:phosphatidylserine/phosphatidylglycerophosphate/cardiolipin synthase-like enzyme
MGAKGDFVVVTLFNGETPIFVHSKVMIVDDEFTLIGSANLNQRSMTHDSEVAVGILDAGNNFAKELRMRLWSEHLEVAADDPDGGFGLFKEAVSRPSGKGRVRRVDSGTPAKPKNHAFWIRSVIDPYSGPER